jgi:hypothetical protein
VVAVEAAVKVLMDLPEQVLMLVVYSAAMEVLPEAEELEVTDKVTTNLNLVVLMVVPVVLNLQPNVMIPELDLLL